MGLISYIIFSWMSNEIYFIKYTVREIDFYIFYNI